jgi:bacillithiol system protein YtxJ
MPTLLNGFRGSAIPRPWVNAAMLTVQTAAVVEEGTDLIATATPLIQTASLSGGGYRYLEAGSLCAKPNRSANIRGFSGATMDNHFKRVKDTEELDALVESYGERPLVIFKHSLTCPISSAAYDQMEQYEGRVALIEIQNARGLSSAIASRFGVTHESPQVIVLRKGQVVWNASHFKITAETVAKAVREAGEAV